MSSRLSDKQIEALPTNEEQLRTLMQIEELPANPQLRAEIAAAMQQSLRSVKEMASYWLGLLAFEKGQYKVAADFFEKRTIQAFPDGTFTNGARYNLGRTYERWGIGDGESPADLELIQKAVAAYESVDDPDIRPACQIRADRLQSMSSTVD